MMLLVGLSCLNLKDMRNKKKIEPKLDLDKLTLENYVLMQIKKRERDLEILKINEKEYSKQDYHSLWSRYHGAISDLLICLTAYNNPLSQVEIKSLPKSKKRET